MTERVHACWCVAHGKETCDCDVPFIGNFAEADERISAGTLRSLDLADVKAAVMADMTQGAERLKPPEVVQASVEIVVEKYSGGHHEQTHG